MFQLRDAILQRDHTDILMSSRGVQGLTVSVVFTGLATWFVAVRMYTRIKLMRKVESNDWMVIIALVNSYVFMGLDIVEALSGMGTHIKDIPPHILERQMKAFWLTIPFYNAAVLCAKASILMQYFRVFPTYRMRVVCWVMISILAIYGTWAVTSAFLNCIPVAKFWDPSIQGHCLSKTGLWFSNASMHIATDLAILIIPIPALMAVDLPRKQKFALMLMFGLGGFVCITSIVRLTSLKKIADSTDPTYDNVAAAAWSAVECNTGIICACLPTLKPLLARLFPGMMTTFSASRPSYGDTAHHNSTWNGDDSTLGAPGDDPEYGSGDPERVLELGPGADFRNEHGHVHGTSWSQEEKKGFTQISSISDPNGPSHQASHSSDSVDSMRR
ncbi:uncharacterized protein N7511_000570 [Penicillium nucicola]|uniref:uncharacterized protein n=1 Tax=Penicillium nucicola TaxID=1850975 RepID=UPI00254566CB|nr:uncharacterized protein N7511_000570 [Penicillium nucicola]KAJ5775559.1 hypothetical protein N7511_000570 [Penicillium nucicola]